mmetsp:Transcript_4898/g.15040  ORF Transcript_4898/g.15040 Transcript_4898/m.15040 type:complete len:290 (+) Transcript_4898:389-1258(+)
MTASRPPGRTRLAAAARIASSSSISALTSMRSAWKTRAARLVSSFGAPGCAAFTTLASCAVLRRGRAATRARESGRERRSSPCLQRTSAISAVLHSLRMVAAVSSPLAWSIRMSSGPSNRIEKPRDASSIWCELTPRSSSTPESRAPSPGAPPAPTPTPARDSAAGKRPKLVCSSVAAPLSTCVPSRRRACRIASPSRSAQTSRPPAGASTSSSAAEWPPPPSVRSAYVPAGSVTSHRTSSSRRTGTWYSSQPPAGPAADEGEQSRTLRPREQAGSTGAATRPRGVLIM